jgi:hypothetical protein
MSLFNKPQHPYVTDIAKILLGVAIGLFAYWVFF